MQEGVIQGGLDSQRVQDAQVVHVPTHGYQDPIGGKGNEIPVVRPDMPNGEIREDLVSLARTMTTHVNRSVKPRFNAIESTMNSILRDFVRVNSLISLGYNLREDP